MSIIHLLGIPMTGLGLYGGYRGDKWLENRLAVFKAYVLPSLLNQSNKNFTVWFQWRAWERANPIVTDFVSFLNKVRGLSFVHTYHGVTIWDDKHPDSVAEKKLRMSLNLSLPELRETVGEADHVLLTCQPSDDCYGSKMVETVQETFKKADNKNRLAIGYEKGYVLNCATKEIAEYNPETLPPFATLCFPKNKFLNPDLHYDHIGPYKSHEYVRNHFRFVPLRDRGFLVGTHGANISTVWNHPYKGREILNEERDHVWTKFGIYSSDPVVVHIGIRLWGRKLINTLPKPLHDLTKWAYHKLREQYANR